MSRPIRIEFKNAPYHFTFGRLFFGGSSVITMEPASLKVVNLRRTVAVFEEKYLRYMKHMLYYVSCNNFRDKL